MSWQTLLADGKVRSHRTSQQELDALRAVIERDLTDSALPSLSADRRFATAYNAALQASKMVIACAGYRVSGMGHHQTTFDAAELALGATSASYIAYFDTCRRKRNMVDYDTTQVASDTDAQEIVREAEAFRQWIEQWITQHYPQYKKV